jgi:ankyrin repeat protein
LYKWAFYHLVDHPLLDSPQLAVDEIMKICWLLEDHGDDSELCFGPENDMFSCLPCPEKVFTRIREHSFSDFDEATATWTSFLRQRHVDIDYQNEEGKTPLMRQLATYYETNADPRAVVLWLCVCGANVHARDVYGREVLHWAVDCCSLQTHNEHSRIERCIQTESGLILNPEWHEMVVAMITMLIRAGADIYAIDDYGVSVGSLAQNHQTLPQLKESLRSTGILWSDFIEEYNLRLEAWLEERVRLHSAKRTAFDPKDLEMPSRATIMRRRAWVPAIDI